MGNSDSKPQATKPEETKQQDTNEQDSSLWSWEKDEDVPQRLDFDIWYPLISKHTMNSVLIECTKEEVDAITNACDENRSSSIQLSCGTSRLTDINKKTLQLLANKIDKFINDNKYSSNG
eukprot:221174_1